MCMPATLTLIQLAFCLINMVQYTDSEIVQIARRISEITFLLFSGKCTMRFSYFKQTGQLIRPNSSHVQLIPYMKVYK